MALHCSTTSTPDRESSSASSSNNLVSVRSLVDAFEANVESSASPFHSFVSFSSSGLHDSRRPSNSYQDNKLSIVTIGSEADAAVCDVERQCCDESLVEDVPPCRPALPPPSLLPDVVVCSTAVDKQQYSTKIENATAESSPFERNSPKSSLSNSILKRPTSGPCPPIVNRPTRLDIRRPFTDNNSLTALAADNRFGAPADDPPTPILFAAVKSIFERQARSSHQHHHHGHSYQRRPHQHQHSSSQSSCNLISVSSAVAPNVEDRQRRIRVRKPVTSSTSKDVGSIRRRESSVNEQLESPECHHQYQQQQENPETEKKFETNCVLADENIDSPVSGAVCRLKALFNHRTSSPASTESRLNGNENGLHRHVTVNKSIKAPIVPIISSVSVSVCRSQASKSNCSGGVIAVSKSCNAGQSFEKRSKVACASNTAEKKSHLTVKFKESASNLQSSSDAINAPQQPTDVSHEDSSIPIIPRHISRSQPGRTEIKSDENGAISRSGDTNAEQPLAIDLLSACREKSSDITAYDPHTLNLSAHKQRVHLRQRGSLANRRKPSRASLRAASMASEESADHDADTGDVVICSPAKESEEVQPATTLMTRPMATPPTTPTVPALPWVDELKQRWERRTAVAGTASLATSATDPVIV